MKEGKMQEKTMPINRIDEKATYDVK